MGMGPETTAVSDTCSRCGTFVTQSPLMVDINTTLNKLFFRMDVSRAELRKAWDLHANNPLARTAFILALFSLFLWPLGVVVLPMAVVALRRVNPTAMPPQGRKGYAIAAIVFSTLGILVSVGFVLSRVL